MNRRASEWERQRAREIAAAALAGRVTTLEAVRELYPLAHTDAIFEEEDRVLIIAIDSETDDLPIGKVRELWAPDALEEKDREIKRAEELYKDQFLEACKRIAWPSDPRQ
jgi:hypothetical protein